MAQKSPFTEAQLAFMRADLDVNFGYTQIIMIDEFTHAFKARYTREHPTAPAEAIRIETLEALKAFRIQKGWDPRNPQVCKTCWHRPYKRNDNACRGCECQNRSCETCSGVGCSP